MMDKIVVYTALFGSHDILEEPEKPQKGIDYVVYTDNPDLRTNIYQKVVVPIGKGRTNNRIARNIKYYPHLLFPNHEVSIWVDARMSLVSDDIKNLVSESLSHSNFATFIHSQRISYLEEVEACIARNKDNPFIIGQQRDIYLRLGVPVDTNLYETTSIIRKHAAPEVIKFNEKIVEQLNSFSGRDQLAMSYVLWRTGLHIAPLEGSVISSSDFIWHPRRTIVDNDYRFWARLKEYYIWKQYIKNLPIRLDPWRKKFV